MMKYCTKCSSDNPAKQCSDLGYCLKNCKVVLQSSNLYSPVSNSDRGPKEEENSAFYTLSRILTLAFLRQQVHFAIFIFDIRYDETRQIAGILDPKPKQTVSSHLTPSSGKGIFF